MELPRRTRIHIMNRNEPTVVDEQIDTDLYLLVYDNNGKWEVKGSLPSPSVKALIPTLMGLITKR